MGLAPEHTGGAGVQGLASAMKGDVSECRSRSLALGVS